MSVPLRTSFHETRVLAQALLAFIAAGQAEETDLAAAEDALYYLRSALWENYPYQSEDWFDQDAPGHHKFSLKQFSPEKIEDNIARREALNARRRELGKPEKK